MEDFPVKALVLNTSATATTKAIKRQEKLGVNGVGFPESDSTRIAFKYATVTVRKMLKLLKKTRNIQFS